MAPSTDHTRYLDRGEGRLAYDVTGEGPLVVLVPGMGDVRSVYRFLAPALVDAGYRVASLDLRGHGESDTTFTSYDDRALGSDILALIEHLGGPATVAGNSMGAGAAVWAAAQRPEAIGALALLGPFVRDVPTNAAKMVMFRLMLAKPWGKAAWLSWHRRLYPTRPPADLGAQQALIRASLERPGGWDAFAATTRTTHAPAEASLDSVHVPTLVVMGERDADFASAQAEAELVARRLRGQVVMVAGAGHYPQAEMPELVIPAVLGFLAQSAARA
ncbi:MAG TPA: alpha/beta hydrolase [Actinomycetes bacterium]|nr:alpha/beta hydrolase [Actinomycetes bacterium]